MKKFLYAFFLLVLLSGTFLAGSWYNQRETAKVNPSGVKSTVVSTDVQSGTTTVTVTDTDTTNIGTSSLPPGTVRITPEKQQVIGVRTGVVEKAAVEHFIRTVGRGTPDEKGVYRLVAGTAGGIRETYD